MRCRSVVMLFCLCSVVILAGQSALAYSPIIHPLPNIYIGDAEDNVGTVDNNLFRFSDALDLDWYVTDDDTTISVLAWSFIEDPLVVEDILEINGVTQLDDEADALDPAAVGKDIRHQPAPFDDTFIDFWDLQDCPKPLNLPYDDPDPGLNTIVTFFVSDGTFIDSAMTIVQISDGVPAFDHLSYPYPPPPPVF